MQAFEYLVPLVAILVGLALADIAMSLHRLLRAGSRVRWHWHAPATAIIVVLLMLDIWWGLRQAEQLDVPWTIGFFLPMLFGLLGFFLLAAAALPDEVREGGVDLREYYRDNARYFWLLFAGVTLLITGHVISMSWSMVDDLALGSLLVRYVPNLIIVLGVLSLTFVRRQWWHSVVIVSLMAVMLASNLARPLA